MAWLALCALSACKTEPVETVCKAPERPVRVFFDLERVPGLPSFDQPVTVTQDPEDPDQLYVLEKEGLLKGVRGVASGQEDPEVWTVADFGDQLIKIKECGLLSMAFVPGSEGEEVVISSCQNSDPSMLRIARYDFDRENHTVDPDGARVILEVPNPRHIHNGGQVRFDRDGMLVAGIGDTGPQRDPKGFAQNAMDLQGSFIRLDLSEEPYAIPSDNPFAPGSEREGEAAPEIFAYGFRNPWSWSFDRETGEIWAGDVGFNTIEEIDHVQAGKNYGWASVEGDWCRIGYCRGMGFTAPVATILNTASTAVIGGYVYRGEALPMLQGTYVFANYGGGTLYGITDPYEEPDTRIIYPSTGISVSSLFEDDKGELYVVDIGKGGVYKLMPAKPHVTGEFPRMLSETGCVQFDDQGNPAPAGGAIGYAVNMPLWSDGARKQRYVSVAKEPAWFDWQGDGEFPIGTVFVKLFALNDELVEGRLLVRHEDGEWGGYSYEWDPGMLDGVLLEEGKTKAIGEGHWTYPSREECFTCHSAAAGITLGPEIDQLSAGNQLEMLEEHGIIEHVSAKKREATALTARDDEGALEPWVRSYLQANCAMCHRPGGPQDGDLDLRYVVDEDGNTLPLEDMHICDAAPSAGDLGIKDAAILRPGNPEQSTLYARMLDLGEDRMPPVASAVVDEVAAEKVAAWIDSLAECP